MSSAFRQPLRSTETPLGCGFRGNERCTFSVLPYSALYDLSGTASKSRHFSFLCMVLDVHPLQTVQSSRKEPTIGFRLLYYALILALVGAFTAWFYIASGL